MMPQDSAKNPAKLEKLSAEGIPLRDYRWGHLAIAAIPAILFWALTRAIRFTTREPDVSRPTVPGATLAIGFHRDLAFFLAGSAMWKPFANHDRISWIGIHHWASYWGSFELWLRGFHCFRYDRSGPTKPFHQIVHFLKNDPLPCVIRTDAGGPYDRVKVSAIRMAIQSQRDLIGFRQTADHKFRSIAGHFIPMPFTKIHAHWGKLHRWQDLAAMPEDQALTMIQTEMEALAK